MTADRGWFEPLAMEVQASAVRYATWLTKDRATGEEIVQEALLRSWRSGSTPSEREEFRRWLYRVIGNLATDHLRRRAVLQRLHLAPSEVVDPATLAERNAEDRSLNLAMDRLPTRDRRIIYLRWFEDRPWSEVAALVGSTESAARVTGHRALARLRALMDAGEGS